MAGVNKEFKSQQVPTANRNLLALSSGRRAEVANSEGLHPFESLVRIQPSPPKFSVPLVA